MAHAEFVPSFASEFPNDNSALHDGAVWVCLEIGGALRPVVRPKRLGLTSAEPPGTADRGLAAVGSRSGGAARTDAEPRAQPAEASPDFAIEVPPEAVIEGPFAVPCEAWSEDVAEVVFSWLFAPATTPHDAVLALAKLGTYEVVPPPIGMIALPADEASLALLGLFTSGADDHLPHEASDAVAVQPVATLVEASQPSKSDQMREPSSAFSSFVEALVHVALSRGHTRAAAVLPALLDGGCLETVAADSKLAESLVSAGVAEVRGATLTATADFLTTASAWKDVLSGVSDDLSACGTSTLDEWALELLVALGACDDARAAKKDLRRRGVAAFGMRQAA